MQRRNFYVNSEKSGQVLLALNAARENLSNSTSSGLWVVTETMAQLKDSEISAVLGARNSEILYKKGQLNWYGKPVRYFTSRTLPKSALKSIVLLVYPSESLMTKVDALIGTETLIVVPWTSEDIQHWIDAHGPTDLLSLVAAQTISPSDPVLIAALDSLLEMINRSTGMAHPSDKDRTIDTFRILAKGRVRVEPDEVRAWLIQNGLKAQYADDIAAIAASPSGFRKHNSRSSWRSDILSVWKGVVNA